MSIHASLNAIRDLLQAQTQLDTHVGTPGRSWSGLFVWPYRVIVAATERPSPTRVNPTVPAQPVAPALDIAFLVIAQHADAGTAFDALDAAMRTLHDDPVCVLPTGRLSIASDTSLDVPSLAALFQAAGVRQRIGLEFVARFTPAA